MQVKQSLLAQNTLAYSALGLRACHSRVLRLDRKPECSIWQRPGFRFRFTLDRVWLHRPMSSPKRDASDQS